MFFWEKILDEVTHVLYLMQYVSSNTSSTSFAFQRLRSFTVPPRIIESAKRELVKSGELATMWCEAVGVPKPTITWMRDDQVLTNTALDDRGNTHRKSLMFNNVSVDDAGVYTCKAENWAGTASKDFDLVVIKIVAFLEISDINGKENGLRMCDKVQSGIHFFIAKAIDGVILTLPGSDKTT
ncbi:immunoglobulin I-set domain protein [Ancylostoma ceylanicum]|uniref:Immunoglobulin I-set domain protein n=1 Tax=Ancylostoma ceylanicum TaxID=53326 RepID=A0A0D6M6C2_9BILA|nr:immunoglobulin I-set domain protein [Ancylostoma ceylanicum]